MRLDKFSFGSFQIDGVARDYDLAIEGGEVRKRKKKPSKQFRDEFGHTPLCISEDARSRMESAPWPGFIPDSTFRMCPVPDFSLRGFYYFTRQSNK